MKVYFLFIAAFLAAILMDSCGNSPEPPQPTSVTYSNPFFPLEVGNYWTYTFYFRTSDTLLRCSIVDSVNINGNKYFLYSRSYRDTLHYRNDTLYLRFINNSNLVRYIGGVDSPYINFDSVTYSTDGQYYPGLVFEYPMTDSVPIGRFDSCKKIVFSSREPDYSNFVQNIGAVVIGREPLLALKGAKVGGTIY
jgi:hypothetical protein